MEPKGDKPRKIVVCHPDHYLDVQRAVAKLGYGDVLVQPNRHVETGKMYIIDGDAMDRALHGHLRRIDGKDAHDG